MKAFRVRVQGRVQGVCFRYYTELEANRLGISGWVRNCADGSVEALICGDEQQTQAMLVWLQQGPPSASVAAVDVESVTLENEPRAFKVSF